MKLKSYLTLIGAIAGFFALAAYSVLFKDEFGSSENLTMPFAVFSLGGMSIGIFVGSQMSKPKGNESKPTRVRPIVYWPTMFVLVTVFTKSANWTVFCIWMLLGLLIGGVAEIANWTSRKKLNRTDLDLNPASCSIQAMKKFSARSAWSILRGVSSVITISFVLYAAGFFVRDYVFDWSKSISVFVATPIYADWEPISSTEPIGAVRPDEKLRVLRIRYGKEFKNVKVEREDGSSGWLVTGPGVIIK